MKISVAYEEGDRVVRADDAVGTVRVVIAGRHRTETLVEGPDGGEEWFPAGVLAPADMADLDGKLSALRRTMAERNASGLGVLMKKRQETAAPPPASVGAIALFFRWPVGARVRLRGGLPCEVEGVCRTAGGPDEYLLREIEESGRRGLVQWWAEGQIEDDCAAWKEGGDGREA
jgi:hypothetical protein